MHPATMSAKARERLKAPRTRGAFQPIDAARRQLGLLAVADAQGQARLSWLVDLPTQSIADARFLAFGALASHPVADLFTELVRGRPVVDACRLTAEQVEALLRDDPATPAFADQGLEPLAFIRDLQERALAELPGLQLLPKPEERQVYQRKRKQDWNDADTRWFNLSLLRKISRVDAVAARVLQERLGRGTYTIEGLHDDFRVVVIFAGLATEEIPTVAQFIQDALRGEVHDQLVVDGRSA